MNSSEILTPKMLNSEGTIATHQLRYDESFEYGVSAFTSGDYITAIQYFETALEIVKGTDKFKLQLACQDQLSHCYFKQYKFNKMLVHATEALAFCDTIDVPDKKVNALNRIGIAYGAFGINEDALEHFLAAVTLAEDINHKDLSVIYNNISIVYYQLGNLERSFPYLEKGLRLAESSNEKLHQITCLSNFGQRYVELGRFEEAKSHLNNARIVLTELDKPSIMAVTIYENLGDCFREEGNYQESIDNYHIALDILKNWASDSLKASILLNLALVYKNLEKYDLALYYLLIGLEAAIVSNSLQTKYEIHKFLSTIYKELGDYKQALLNHEDYHNTREQVHNNEAERRLQGMMLKLDVNRIQQEKELAEKEQELSELKYLELSKLAQQLELQNKQDALTKVSNRGHLDEFLAMEFTKAKTLNDPISVMMCDADNFKKVNDTLSHAVGDEVLRQLANLLKNNIRSSDLVARYGGEEFVVVFCNTNLDHAVTIAEKLREIIEEHPWQSINPDLTVTVSVGVASGTEYVSHEKLLARADDMLYKAKHAGKNQVKF